MSDTVEVDASALQGVLCHLGLVQPMVESDERALVRFREQLCHDIIDACTALDEQTDKLGLSTNYEQMVWDTHGPETSLPIQWVADHRTETYPVECGGCHTRVPLTNLIDVYPRDNLPEYSGTLTERTPLCSDCRDRYGYEPVEPTSTCHVCDTDYPVSDGRTIPKTREHRDLYTTVCPTCADSTIYLEDLTDNYIL